MKHKCDVKVFIDGNIWNYYPGYVVYDGVEWMVPREYYKDRDEYKYKYGTFRNGTEFDMNLFSEDRKKLIDAMKGYGEYLNDWIVVGTPTKTDEPLGVHLAKEPHITTDQEKRDQNDRYAAELSRFD